LSPEVEEALARCPSAQIPLNPNVAAMPRVRTPSQVKAMKVSFEDAAKAFARAAERVEAELLKP
jgi:hypothetical protein